VAAQPGCPESTALQALLAGQLPPAEEDALTAHLGDCAACRSALEGLAAGADSWAGLPRSLKEEPVREEAALREALARAAGGLTHAGDTEPGACGDGELALDFLDPPERPGSMGRVSTYEVLEVIGRGGMGVVFKAFDSSLERVVAVKVLAPQIACLPSARQRFLREARAAAAVRHEQVVAIHAVSEFKGLPFLVMEHVPGTSLAERLAGESLPLEEVLHIALLTAQGLEAAHAQGLVHRDVKPANILLESGTGRVKLTDFGLALARDDVRLTQSGAVAGTPLYMSPEQARGEAVDARTDLFSLGSVLYVICTGRPPFEAGAPLAVLRRVCDETPRPVRKINPAVPAWLAAVIARLHAKVPAERLGSAAEVADLLRRRQAPSPRRRGPGARRLLWGAAVLGLLAVLGVAAWRVGPALFQGEPAGSARPAVPSASEEENEIFPLDDGRPLPGTWQPSPAMTLDRDGLRLNGRHYVRTKAGDFLTRDFRFEVVFAVKAAEENLGFIGLGKADRDAPFNEPGGSLYLRIHPPGIENGWVGLANGSVRGNIVIGNILRAGTYRAGIEKKGDAVTFRIDGSNDSGATTTFAKTIPDVRSFAPYLGEQSTHLFFGGANTYQQIRLSARKE
jgi:hypothetical protein